jgi:hypothetical protein
MAEELDHDVRTLGELLALLGQCPQHEESRMAQDYIHEARTHLLSAMYADYVLDLEFLRHWLTGAADLNLRAEADRIITDLIETARTI